MILPRALQHRNYRLFFGGQAFSLLGMWLQMTAQAWLMLQLTGSAAAVGLLAVAQQGPGLVLGPLAGALADRYDKRRLLMGAQAMAAVPALLLGVLTLLGHVEAWHIAAMALFTGLTRAVEIPTRQAILPDIVGLPDLASAIGLNSALFNGARLVGPPLAGAITVSVGAAWCFLGNAVSYGAIVVALAMLDLPEPEPRARPTTSLLQEVGDAARYAADHPRVRALFIGLAISSLLGMPYSVLLPSFAARILSGGAGTFGLLQGAIGAGAITSALILASRRNTDGLERWVVAAAALFGTSLVLLSQCTRLLPALGALFLIGTGVMIQAASTNTLVQFTVPNELRGRVMSLHAAIFLGGLPIGGLVFGAAADRVGEAPVMLVGGVGVALGAIVLGRNLLGKPLEPGGETAPEVRAP